MLTARLLPVVSLGIVLLGGCSAPNGPIYEPRLELADIATGLPAAEDSYRLAAETSTSGRFPCTIAIAKLTLPPDGVEQTLRAAPISPADQGRWVEVFSGFLPVRDLTFLSPRDLKTNGNGVRGLLVAAERLGAPLLLVYAPNRVGPNSAQVLGALFDVPGGAARATLHAEERFLDDEGVERSRDGEFEDYREVDAQYQAARAFERQALECIREQARRDVPPGEKQPHRWIPLYPMEWLPEVRPEIPPPGAGGAGE